jgi:hypothetical protein
LRRPWAVFKVTVTLTFKTWVEVIAIYNMCRKENDRHNRLGVMDGQSFDFDLEYLENYVKVKVKVKCER